jgi:hemerythrin
MSLFAWSDKYSLHIGQIDEQHKKLVGMLNELFDAMKAGKGNDVLDNVLSQLIAYTKSHFATEERLMKAHGYPDHQAHKAEHDELTKQVVEFQQRFQARSTGLSMELMAFLKNWLINHIQGSDKHYAPFLHGKGVR